MRKYKDENTICNSNAQIDNMDNLGKLLLFRDVVDAGGFSHAAARRKLSHSTVSKHIKSLEAELGVSLLNRTSRSMSLTEAGSLVLGYSRRVGSSVEELRERLDELRGEVVGELRINSLVHVGRCLVQPAIASYVREFPRSRVQLFLDDGPLHFNREGYDLALRVGLHAEGSLTASKLVDNRVCIVAAPALIERWGAPSHPSELAELPAVVYHSPQFDISAWTYVEAGEFRTVEVQPVCEVNEGNALLELVLAGLGVGYLSAFAVEDCIRRGELVRLLPEVELPPFEPVFMIHAATEHPSLKLRAFKRHLREQVARLAR